MSETDDTDDLLLIPPDFFVQDPDFSLQPPYLTVFDSIITQVNKLENRLDHIESVSDISLTDDRQMYNGEDRYVGLDSAQSTPQKPRTKFKLNSLPSSPSADRYSPRRPRTNLFAPKNYTRSYQDVAESNYLARPDPQVTSSKVKNPILTEIDEFISNVKTIERINKGKEYDPTKRRLDVEDINKLIQKLEKEEEKQEVSNNANTEYNMKYVMYKDREAKESTEPKTATSPQPKTVQPSQKTLTTTDSYITEDVRSATSSEDTQTTALHYVKSAPEMSQIPVENFMRENKVTLTYKRDVKQNFPGNYAGDGARSSVPSIDSLKLLSLRDLWSQKDGGEFNVGERTRLFQKLEEEKLRRQVRSYFIIITKYMVIAQNESITLS